MNTKALAEKALSQLDNIGYQLDEYGITSQFNRHTCIAFIMNEQTRLKGEIDSIQARVDAKKVQAEQLVEKIEDTVSGAVDFALTPARTAFDTVKGLIRQ